MTQLPAPHLPIPAPLRGSDPNSFAERTIKVRLPKIAQKLIEEGHLPQTAVSNLRALIQEIPNTHLNLLPDTHAPDAAAWNEAIRPYLGQNWLTPPWFFIETYFYRRIISAVDTFSRGIDPFQSQKVNGLQQTISSIRTLSQQVHQFNQTGWHTNSFTDLLMLDLWGNQVDLSLWSADESPDHSETDASAFLLANDATAVAAHLDAISPYKRRVDFILDNAAFELIGDFALADYLLATEKVATVHFHYKLHPTFVSDATRKDIIDTIQFLQDDTDVITQAMGKRMAGYLENGRLQLQTHPFWTSPHPMWHMPHDLRQALAPAHLVISKGDANYRRCIGDAHWPYTTPFNQVVSYFPAPLLTLRTCKSNALIGLSPGRQAQLDSQHPNWIISGQWGVIQFVDSR